MLKLYDVVVSTEDISDSVPQGTVGTVLLVYDSNNYEVEFVNSDLETLDVLTVPERKIALKDM